MLNCGGGGTDVVTLVVCEGLRVASSFGVRTVSVSLLPVVLP